MAAPRAPELGFHHLHARPRAGRRTLLLLHGTGGDERDLLPVAREVAPDAGVLSVRGNVIENGMPRFFRRLAHGVLDIPDLVARTHELAAFLEAAERRYAIRPQDLVALGYSNGANIAASLLFLRPDRLAGAILARAMVPYEPDAAPDLAGKRVLILGGASDPYSHAEVTERLAEILRAGGADVEPVLQPTGHGLGREDLRAAAEWLRRVPEAA